MKKILVILLGLALIIWVAACSGDTVEKDKIDQVSKIDETVEDVDTEEDLDIEEIEDINEEIDITVTLNGVERTKEDGWIELEEGTELILVDLTIKNNSNQVYEFMPNSVTLIINGLTASRAMVTSEDKEPMKYNLLEPGEEYRGITPFQVLEGMDYDKIMFNGLEVQ